MHKFDVRILGGIAAGALTVSAFAVDPTPVSVVVKQGDALGGSTVSALNAPFTDGNGKVGFVGSLGDARRFIWHDNGPIFFSPAGVTGGESTMGVGNAGQFIYSPSVNSNDAVYTNGGVLLQGTDPMPGFPGRYSTFSSRPTMLPNGTAFWMGGSSTTPGGSSSNRHFLKATDPTNPASISAVFSGGDVIAGKTLTTTASNFDYWVSDNGLNHIHVIQTSGNINNVYLNGAWVHEPGQAAQPAGNGNWQNWDSVAVNNSGNYLISGDTDAASTSDYFIAYNGVIGVKEGDTVDGVTIASGATARAISISNGGLAAYIFGWGTGSSLQEHLFLGSASALGSATRILSLNDEVDVNSDNVPDYKITDFEASASIGPGLDLADDGRLFVEVSMIPVAGGAEFEAIIYVPEPTSISLLALMALAFARRR